MNDGGYLISGVQDMSFWKNYFFSLSFSLSEHTRNARKSTKGKHQKGQARKNKDQQRSNKNRG